jgi:hypothetical protein
MMGNALMDQYPEGRERTSWVNVGKIIATLYRYTSGPNISRPAHITHYLAPKRATHRMRYGAYYVRFLREVDAS